MTKNNITRFFTHPTLPAHRLYEALRAYFVENRTAKDTAEQFGYHVGTLYVLASQFRAGKVPPFFIQHKPGPKRQPKKDAVRCAVMELRKKNYSVYDIHRLLRNDGHTISVRAIWEILKDAGFARLPRRLDEERPDWPRPIQAAYADRRQFNLSPRKFRTQAGGLFLFLPFLVDMRIDQLVRRAGYPGTKAIPPLQYFLSLLSLKLLSRERISYVMDLVCDPGAALWCGLNILPKTTALTTYSYRIRRSQNRAFLKLWNQALLKTGLVKGKSFNLDFHAIAHFGEESVLEKNYVPRRSHAEKSVMTFLAQDGESTVLCYSNAVMQKKEQSDEVLAFTRFWKETAGSLPDEVVFDSRLTTYDNLSKLNAVGVQFLTLRRKSTGLVQQLMSLPASSWTRCELDVPHRKYKTPKIIEQKVRLQGYRGEVRQIAAKDLGRDLPTILITNNFKTQASILLTRYAKRMIIENAIADGINFFHLDALCSSLKVEVDFSVVLTVVANGLYHLFGNQIKGFEQCTAKQLHRKFINTIASIEIMGNKNVNVHLSLRAHNPLLMEAGFKDKIIKVPWLENVSFRITIPTNTRKP